MNTTAIVICLIGIAVAIVLGYKWNVNMGATAMVFAWIAANDFVAARLDIQMLSFCGFVVCTLMKLAKPAGAIKSVLWNTIILIGGIGILLGANYTAISPFSTGGAIFMSNCNDETVRGKLIGWQLGLAVLGMAATVILGMVGFLGLF